MNVAARPSEFLLCKAWRRFLLKGSKILDAAHEGSADTKECLFHKPTMVKHHLALGAKDESQHSLHRSGLCI
jgi:hypothetical protein